MRKGNFNGKFQISAFLYRFHETGDILSLFRVIDISKTIEDLSEEIGEEFAKKLSSVRDINPGMWTPTLENYIDTVLE